MIVEMGMLRWMSGSTLEDHIKNDNMQDKLDVAPVEDKMGATRLSWFGHARRRPTDATMRKDDSLKVIGTSRGR